MLAIASFIIHYWSWQAAIRLGSDVRVDSLGLGGLSERSSINVRVADQNEAAGRRTLRVGGR